MPTTPPTAGEKPRRRWFQFRLTTWFVLVAILAWGMWLGPREYRTNVIRLSPRDRNIDPYLLSSVRNGAKLENVESFEVGSTKFEKIQVTQLGINPSLLWPALALAAFIGWKGFWLLRERRRVRAANP